jgi:NADH-quinone oxidoreductase subunit M
MFPILSVMTYLPLVGALILMVLPRNDNLFRWFSLGLTFINFVLSLYTTIGFDRNAKGYQYEETISGWIPSIGSKYHMGVDGVSVLMVQLDGLLFFLAIIASWKPIQTRVREYYIAMLLLNVGLVGIFCALDFFLFYIFWELVLIPMAILIGIWGGPRKLYAAVKFFLYTLVGSLLMLVAIIAVYFQYSNRTGLAPTLDIPTITNAVMSWPAQHGGQPFFDTSFQFWAFLAFGLAFAIKVPLWPFHTWLPDAHTEAPTAGSVILAGVMLKMGCYGFIRFNLPLFPDASKTLAPVIIVMSLIAIIYGAWVAMVQPDMKRLVAYSSVSHMGFVMLGLFTFAYGLQGQKDVLLGNNTQAFSGAVMQMFSHGLLTGGLFLGVGVIYDRLHTRDIQTIQNTLRVANRMPLYASIFMLYTMGSLGLPGISGFIGEFLVFQGAFRVTGAISAIASVVIILAAVYMLWVYQRVIFGKPGNYDPAVATAHDSGHGGHADHAAASNDTHAEEGHGHGHHPDPDILDNGAKFPDLNFGEWFTLYPMGILAILVGIFPSWVLDFFNQPAQNLTTALSSHGQPVVSLLDYLGQIIH